MYPSAIIKMHLYYAYLLYIYNYCLIDLLFFNYQKILKLILSKI